MKDLHWGRMMKALRKLWTWFLGLFRKETEPTQASVQPETHPWNSPRRQKGRLYKWANHPRKRQSILTKRERARRRRWLKRVFGLTRKDMGRIGAGHMEQPEGYYLTKWKLGL